MGRLRWLPILSLCVASLTPACNDIRLDRGSSETNREDEETFPAPGAVPVPQVTQTPAATSTPSPTPVPGASPTPTPEASAYPLPCNEIYDPNLLPTFEIEVDSGVLATLQADHAAANEVWRPAVFRYEGEEYPGVEVRIRGNNSSCGDMMQLAIAFHHVYPDQRFRGLKRLDLDHGSCRILYERVSMEFLRDRLGMIAPCANNARLEINGSFYGIYANLEHQNTDFLERNFALADGNLYKAARDKKTNESDPDTSDLDALKDATTVADYESLVDLDQAVRMWAAEAALPAGDNYWYFGRNYYVYSHPARGFLYLANDYDHALPLSWNWDWAIYPPRSTVATVVLSDPHWRSRFEEELELVYSKLDPEWFDATLDRYWLQVKADVAVDPHISLNQTEINRLKDLFRQRRALIEATIGTP